MDEFQIIDTYFRPLTRKGDPAQNLESDTAIYSPPQGFDLILTKDAMIEGVHFLPLMDPATLARHLLRVNLSDLAAAGAKPVGYLVAIMGPKTLTGDWFENFARGLGQDQEEFGMSLFGGDTTFGAEKINLSLTALGIAPKGAALTRKGARAGDDIYVSGKIGFGHLGLKAIRAGISNEFSKHFELPKPRLELGQQLLGVASAAADISDGLVADAWHICQASGLGAEINSAQVPLADPGQDMLGQITGGDDYELVFTAPPEKAEAIGKISERLATPLTKIGVMIANPGLFVFDENGAKMDIETNGFRHRLNNS